jgi:hypothetical protein
MVIGFRASGVKSTAAGSGSYLDVRRAGFPRLNLVDRSIGWLKQSRRLAARSRRVAENFVLRGELAILGPSLKTP